LNKSLSAAAAPGYRLGPLEFATGMTGRNAWTYLYVCLAIMPVISFLSVSQPYVLTEIIGIPPAKDGQVTTTGRSQARSSWSASPTWSRLSSHL